jgi:LmbE family N-acetylglucosaminyl deacetylase
MAELWATVPSVALAVYAHPDDPEIACGGTLATWAARGAAVHVVIVCAGDKGSHEQRATPSEVAAVRSAEVAEAASAIGLASHRVIGYPDGEVDDTTELRGLLVEAIRTLCPEVVVCPDPTAAFFGRTYVNHRDHRVVGWATLDAVAPAAWSPLYFPAAGAPHRVREVLLSGSLAPDVFVDITDGLDAKTAALRCHASQLGGSDEVMAAAVRQRAEDAGREVAVRYAEGFRLLTPS